MLTADKKTVIDNIAGRLRITNPDWLQKLIRFETGGTYSTQIKNPGSSARGLLQFLDSTARSLGYASSLELVTRHSDFKSQMEGPVYEYLKQWAPYPEEYKLYMAVFFPYAINYPPDTTFREMYRDLYKNNPEKANSAWKAFAKANPGILAPMDYVNFLKGKGGLVSLKSIGTGGALLIIAIGAALYLTGGTKKLLRFRQ